MNKNVSTIYSTYLCIAGQAMVSDPAEVSEVGPDPGLDGVDIGDPIYAHMQSVVYCGTPEL